jgi:hypothetical protein
MVGSGAGDSDGYDWRRQLEDREPRSNGGQDVSWAPQGGSAKNEDQCFAVKCGLLSVSTIVYRSDDMVRLR